MGDQSIAERWEAYVGAVLAASGTTLTLAEAARLMKLTPLEVEEMIASDQLLAVSHQGALHIPMDQLNLRSEPDRLEVIDGISEVIALTGVRENKAYRRLEAVRFLAYPDPAMGRTPFEALRNGQKDRVISLALARLELEQLEHEARETVVRLEQAGEAEGISKAYIFAKAVDVFGSGQAAVEWLRKPALALNRRRPLDLLDASEDLEKLRVLLIQLEYGVFI